MIDFQKELEAVRDQVIAWRRYLHAHPELSFEETHTSQFIYDCLTSFGLEVTRPAGTSVVGILRGNRPGRTVAIRADIDALPILEENDFEFKSQNPGVMHACGHDGHTAMLLGAAKILSEKRDQIQGEIRFLFQSGEEVMPGGAEALVRAGVLEGVDFIIGTHLWASMPTGQIGIIYGPAMAAPDEFRIVIHGKGGHGAIPQETVDSILVGAQVVQALQHIVSRRTDPLDDLVISVCQFHAGTAHNIIADTATLVGTVRTFKPELQDRVEALMHQTLQGICQLYGATYTLEYTRGYAPVINDEHVTRVVEETVREVLGEQAIVHPDPTMGGEDFSAYQKVVPGCFFFTGAGNREKGIVYPHHHPRFTIDEDALQHGVSLFLHTAMKLLAL
jgi:amidohydrolase